MPRALIKLAYQHIIDADSSTPFEKEIFNATYGEFLIQQQSFSKGQDLPTWSAIRAKFPKANPALPFKVSFAIAGLLRNLEGKIPVLENPLSLKPIPFINHYFQLLESDINDPSAHRVCIVYITDILTYYERFGDRLLLAWGQSAARSAQPVQTFMLKMDHRLSIVSYEELPGQPLETSFPQPFALPDRASLFP
jgi:hypothetical protein